MLEILGLMLFLVRRTSYLGKQSIYCLDRTFN